MLCARIISRLLFIMLALSACDNSDELHKTTQTSMPEAHFVDQQSCKACHQQASHDWQGSHHDLAMDIANSKTVLGNFEHATVTAHGVTSSFYKKDEHFFVHTDGKDGRMHDYQIAYVFGFTPLQQYLIKFPDGRIQALDIAWDSREKSQGGQRWFHLHPKEKINAKHPFHWSKRLLNWNSQCAECHSTQVKKTFDLHTNSFKTTWQKIDTGCQACHGPGSNHLNWAHAKDKSPWGSQHGLQVQLAAKDNHVQVDSCARCHARRSTVSKDYAFGKPFMDFYLPQILREPFYHPDGQIKDEVYVYGSFTQSKMHAAGVRCTDCHQAHTAKLKFTGNSLCLRCHQSKPATVFKGLRQKDIYDTPKHHFHPAGSKGAQCIACHMPTKTYMGIDLRRDHSFRIPRPDLSIKLGTPNACTQCHRQKSNQWAAQRIAEWYPKGVATQGKDHAFATVFAEAQGLIAETAGSNDALIRILEDQQEPAIVRATAASLLQRYPNQKTLQAIQHALQDPAPLSRYHAIHSIDRFIPQTAPVEQRKQKQAMLSPLLRDPIRAVRSEAARALSDLPPNMFSKQQSKDLEAARAEYIQRQQDIAERPEAHLNLGLLYQRMGKPKAAEQAYQTAIRLFPDYLPARFNIANLYHQLGRNQDALQVFQDIINIDAGQGEAYYSLGLLLAEMQQLKQATAALHKASQLLPKRPRVHYNYALSLKQSGRDKAALQALLSSVDAQTHDPAILYVLSTWLAEAKRYDEAETWAKQLLRNMPKEAGAKRLLIDIHNQKVMQKFSPSP